jgi:hypothetical protein
MRMTELSHRRKIGERGGAAAQRTGGEDRGLADTVAAESRPAGAASASRVRWPSPARGVGEPRTAIIELARTHLPPVRSQNVPLARKALVVVGDRARSGASARRACASCFLTRPRSHPGVVGGAGGQLPNGGAFFGTAAAAGGAVERQASTRARLSADRRLFTRRFAVKGHDLRARLLCGRSSGNHLQCRLRAARPAPRC